MERRIGWLRDVACALGAPRDLYAWPNTEVGPIAIAKGTVVFAKLTYQNEIFAGALTPDSSGLAAPLARVTSDEGRDKLGGWLDEERVVFGSTREGTPALHAQAPADGPAQIVSRDVGYARVMASGELLGWKRAQPDSGESCALLRIEPTGASTLFVAPADDPAFVACGAELRCVRSQSGRQCIAMEAKSSVSTWSSVDIDTGRKTASLYSAKGVVRAWDVSPAGDTLAFTMEWAHPFINYVSIPSGSLRQARVTPPIEILQFIAYAPDGRHLLLTGMAGTAGTRDGPPYVIATSDLEGHAHFVATTDDGWMNDPFFSPSGHRIAVAEATFQHRLWMLEPK